MLWYRRFPPKWMFFHPCGSPVLGKLLYQTKSSILQIYPHSKFQTHWTTGCKVVTKKFTFCRLKVKILAMTFEPVLRLSPNFESEIICTIHGLFAKAVCRKQVIHLGEKRSTWARISCIFCFFFGPHCNFMVSYF